MSEDVRFTRVIDAAPEVVFDAFTGQGGQEAFYSEPGWNVESECDLRVGGRWTITFGPPGRAPARETNVFEQIDRPRRLVYRSTMALPDGSSVGTHIQVTFEPDNGKTRMTVIQSGFPTAELRDEFGGGWTSILDALGRVATARAAR
jgi:uncharacterized protein YndB with AHSA1/START domain